MTLFATRDFACPAPKGGDVVRSTYMTIQVETRGEAHWLTLNRPEALNAITTPMAEELADYFGGLAHDRSCRVVVLRGAGRAFCAGLDIKAFGEGEPPFGGGFGFQGFLAEVYLKMRRCPQPIIACVHGAAAGGGFAFALAADIRIAGESARMNAAFIRLGLSACDMGVSYFLPRIVGLSVASELMLTGRFIDARRALTTGLVSEVVPDGRLEETAGGYVRDMLEASPMGLRLTKDGLNFAVNSPSLEAAMAIENRNQTLCARTEDFAEGLRAFIEKRKPVYKDA